MQLQEFVPQQLLYYMVLLARLTIILMVPMIGILWWLGPSIIQIIIRAAAVFLLWSTIQARRIDFYAHSHAVQTICSYIVMMTVAYIVLLSLYDICNLTTIVAGYNMLIGSGASSARLYGLEIVLLALIFAEILYCILGIIILNEMPLCLPYLTKCRLDNGSIQRDAAMLGIRFMLESPAQAFAGRGHRLTNRTEVSGVELSVNTVTAGNNIANNDSSKHSATGGNSSRIIDV